MINVINVVINEGMMPQCGRSVVQCWLSELTQKW